MTIIMSLKRSVGILHERFANRITFQNILTTHNARTYYNKIETMEYLALNLKERTRLIELKVKEEPAEPSSGRSLFNWYSTTAPSGVTFNIINMKEWWEYYQKKVRKVDQIFNPVRHEILGNDLATAHFIVARGGKVKFKGHTNWTANEPNKKANFPNVYDPAYIVVELDLNGFLLEYEGLDNICGLYQLKWLSLKGNELANDWYLDKLSGEYPMLEFLDISECKNITERGLEALYRLPNLKKLVVTNYGNSVAMELSCLMLEDVNPHLTCEIHVDKKSSVKEE